MFVCSLNIINVKYLNQSTAVDHLSGLHVVWAYFKWLYMLIGSKLILNMSDIYLVTYLLTVMPEAKTKDVTFSMKRKRQDSVLSQAQSGVMLWKNKPIAIWMEDIIASFLLGE